VNDPVLAVEAPIVVPLIEPPVIRTDVAFWVDMVPKPEIAVFGIVGDAVGAEVPFPYTYPVNCVVVGAAPAPPPRTKPFTARAADVAQVEELEK
jgi:hypothetical protein